MENEDQSVTLCDTMITTNSEIQNELHERPMFKIEVKEEWIDEEEATCDDYKFQYTPFDSTDHGNYDDSKVCEVEMKEKVPEDGCFQSKYSMKSTTVFNVTVKHERLEEQDVLDNHEATSIHYDVLVAPRKVACKFCSRIFQNRFNLFKHNKEHIQIVINTPRDKELIPLPHCQCSDKYSKNDGYMQPHLTDVYSETIFECELCGKHFKSELNLRRHNRVSHKLNRSPNEVIGDLVKCEHCNVQFQNKDILHKHVQLCHTGIVDGKRKYQCASCKRLYKTKYTLTMHVRRCHYDYGRVYVCSCGEQFRTPIHLYEHNIRRHSTNGSELYKCTHCDAVYNVKTTLTRHMKKVHCDYGKAFQCWCGKQFRSPIHLREHISHQHDGKFKNKNKYRVQCALCQKFLKTKMCLYEHIKNIHQFYGETFKCWCGKHFLSPIKLRKHVVGQHERKNAPYSGKFQCDHCQKIFKIKNNLRQHIQDIHFDYGKVFECCCGKQFRSPRRLRKHKERHADDNDINNSKFQCDYCQKIVKNKYNLIRHIKKLHYDNQKTFDYRCRKNIEHIDNYQCDRCDKVFNFKGNLTRHLKNIHHNYGRMFECWCGKQFRTSPQLEQHKKRKHGGDIKNTNKTNPNDTLSKIVHKEV